jgi:hypothetical protein
MTERRMFTLSQAPKTVRDAEPTEVVLKKKSRHPNSYFHAHTLKGQDCQTVRTDWIWQGDRYVHRSGEYWTKQLP